MKNDALNQIAGAYGSIPLATGAQTVYVPTYAFEAEEDTTFLALYDEAGDPMPLHPWAGKTLAEGKTAFFGQNVAKFSISAGGKGQVFPVTDDMPKPVALTATGDNLATTVTVSFDRPVADADVNAFTIIGVDAAVAVGIAAVDGTDPRDLNLTLTTNFLFGDTPLLSMLKDGVKSAFGAIADPFTDLAVSNNILEYAGALASAATNAAGTLLILTYDVDMMDPAAHLADFTVKVGGAAVAATSVALGTDPKTIEITPTVAFIKANVITVSLAAGNVKTYLGVNTGALVNQAVTNSIP